jgi:hypothetical protein
VVPTSTTTEVSNASIDESAFDDVKLAWKKRTGANDLEIESLMNDFRELKKRNLVTGKEGDISAWAPKYEEFKKFVDTKNEELEQKDLESGKMADAELVLENDKCLIIVPRTVEASCKYGAHAKWCTSSKKKNEFDAYTKQNIKLYYVINKELPISNRYSKVGIAVWPNSENFFEAFDSKGTVLDEAELDEVWKLNDIDASIFTNELDFNDWLKGLNYTENEDGTINVKGDVNLLSLMLEELPFTFGEVDGKFDCSNNLLSTLEGCPRKVTGDFICANNLFRSLVGGPQEVGGEYDCQTNAKLTSLEGAPKTAAELRINGTGIKEQDWVAYEERTGVKVRR